jgi:coproporphyrinogen III oxidase
MATINEEEKLFMAKPLTEDLLLHLSPEEGHGRNMRRRMEHFILKLQKTICDGLSEVDGEKKFMADRWEREEGGKKGGGGGGISCVLQDGKVFEKAGVNVSVVHGLLPPPAVKEMRARGKQLPETTQSLPFFAAGISSGKESMSPLSPYFPLATSHLLPSPFSPLLSHIIISSHPPQ